MFLNDRTNGDGMVWGDKEGVRQLFSCKQVWKDLNNFGPKVPWCKIVWFSNNIPRNSFILWMAILEKLKTQDWVISWGINGNLLCPFM